MAKKKSTEDELIGELTDKFKRFNANARASYLWQSSSHIKEWISTGQLLLDIALSNQVGGGIPVGRLTEIAGGEGAGKTLLASYILANTQKKGGVAIMIDTEHAASMEVLKEVGVDVEKLIYIQAGCVEDVFSSMETIVSKVRSSDTDKLITIVWDSVAATSSKAEIEGDYSDRTVAMNARLISQGLRKVIPFISSHRVCMVFINQLRTRIGVTFGDKYVTPGGAAIPFHASVRLRLNHYKELKDLRTKNKIGRVVKCEVKKNKVAPPMRTVYYTIRWGDRPGAWVDEPAGILDAADTANIFEKVTAQKWKFAGKTFTKKTFAGLLDDEEFYNKVKEVLCEKYIITAKNISDDISLEDADPNEGT
jgi:recombination protein RecA